MKGFCAFLGQAADSYIHQHLMPRLLYDEKQCAARTLFLRGRNLAIELIIYWNMKRTGGGHWLGPGPAQCPNCLFISSHTHKRRLWNQPLIVGRRTNQTEGTGLRTRITYSYMYVKRSWHNWTTRQLVRLTPFACCCVSTPKIILCKRREGGGDTVLVGQRISEYGRQKSVCDRKVTWRRGTCAARLVQEINHTAKQKQKKKDVGAQLGRRWTRDGKEGQGKNKVK